MKKERVFIIFCFFIFFYAIAIADIKFKVSGKVVHNGVGIEGIKINFEALSNENFNKSIKTESNGNFSIYLSNGIYEIDIYNQKEYVHWNKNEGDIINVNGKNIFNLIYILKKECVLFGTALNEDGTPAEGNIRVNNKKILKSRNFINGKYRISGIHPDPETNVRIYLNSTYLDKRFIINLTEGEHRQIDFRFPKSISIWGKVVNKNTNETVKEIGVYIRDLDGNWQFTANTDENGKYYFYNMPYGYCYLIVLTGSDAENLKENIRKVKIGENPIEVNIELDGLE